MQLAVSTAGGGGKGKWCSGAQYSAQYSGGGVPCSRGVSARMYCGLGAVGLQACSAVVGVGVAGTQRSNGGGHPGCA